MRKISCHFITPKKHKSLYGNLITVQQKATPTKEMLQENCAAENISNFKRKSHTKMALQKASNRVRKAHEKSMQHLIEAEYEVT